MKKWFLMLSLVFASILVLSGCGEEATSKEPAASTGEVKEFTIKASNFEFDQKEIKVNKGDTVKITLENTQGLHALEVAGYDVEVKDGETITFVASETGEFEYICSIMCGTGHNDMIGSLVVQ
ncbi:cytochrome C oxidase subunit II [Chengkuizengella axinellae]|uniref:Cytochrome C oxidase subunit II n=1 Tax=Chengkuizengella axinellae TaxID=3064388 RepID=A0ABT9IZR7_9BACL|nr:cytochrome C oxidase subunit II [Chengkuizengella sp. 2205SS18-9]MDP5274870.1 cytochrome C oxidase subunit II [Chengkuizengella sp. 2205SS18-9]